MGRDGTQCSSVPGAGDGWAKGLGALQGSPALAPWGGEPSAPRPGGGQGLPDAARTRQELCHSSGCCIEAALLHNTIAVLCVHPDGRIPTTTLERGPCTPQGTVPRLSGWHPRAGPTHGAGGVLCSTSPTLCHGDAAWAARGGSGLGPAAPGANRGAACPPQQGWLFICSQSCLHQPLAPITRRPRPRLRPRHGPGSPGAAGAVLGTREERDGTGCVRELCKG